MIYRVVTNDFIGKDELRCTIHFEGTKSQCWKYIVGRWGHKPPWAAITTRTSNFSRCFY